MRLRKDSTKMKVCRQNVKSVQPEIFALLDQTLNKLVVQEHFPYQVHLGVQLVQKVCNAHTLINH